MPCSVSFAYRSKRPPKAPRIESYYFLRTEALQTREIDACRCTEYAVCGPIPSVPFTNFDKELYLNQWHVTSRSWEEWRNRLLCVLSRFTRIRGMRYRNCITEGHTLLSLQYNSLTIQFSSSRNTHLTTRKYEPRIIFFYSLFLQLCENCVL